MEQGFVAAHIHHEHRSLAVRVAAPARGAIEVALRIQHYTGAGICAVRTIGEAVEYGLVARRIQLEHRSRAGCAATIGCAIQVALAVQHDASVGTCAVRPAGKAVEHGLLAARIHLEYCSGGASTASGSGAVEIVLRVQH